MSVPRLSLNGKSTGIDPSLPHVAARKTRRCWRQRQSLSGYVVQVASFGDEANAERLARELNSEFKAFYRAGDVNGKTYYRVRVGPFENEASANAAAERLRSSGRATLVRRAE